MRGLSAIAILVLCSGAASADSWTDYARKLIGETDAVTRNSKAELRKDKNLPDKLRKSLGSKDHFLALDVMASLNMKEMVPTLLDFAARDRTGYSYHALNTLIEKKDYDRVGSIYRERLKKSKTSLASKMAMIDTLGRIGTDIDPDLVNRLILDDAPEVRSSAIYYLRTAILRRRRQELYPFLKTAIADSTFQNRLQTLYLVSEIPPTERATREEFFTSFFSLCEKDPYAQVKALCAELAAQKGEKK